MSRDNENKRPEGENRNYKHHARQGAYVGERKNFGDRLPSAHKVERRFDGERPRDGHKVERRFDGERPRDGHKVERRFDGERPRNERKFGDDRPKGDRRGKPVEIRPANAREVALNALKDVVRFEAYASQALDRALTDVKLSDEDRRLAASIFYFTIENRIYIEWVLAKLMESKPEPVVNDILHIAAAQILFMDRIPDFAAVDEAVKQVRAVGRGGLDKLVNGVLRSLIRARDAGELTLPDREANPEEYLSVRYSLALPAVKRLIEAYGLEKAEEIIAYKPGERTLTVRPNLTRISQADFEAMLTKDGFGWKPGAAAGSYVLSGAGSLAGHEGYKNGIFSIQGESSMLAAQAVEAKRGMQVLDACAAPGGKTCLMAEQMGGSGRVFAWDVHAHRVDLIRAAAHRLGLENVRPSEHDARRPLASMELSMDAVLVDAPCSGLGVMNDKPDIRFRIDDKELDALLPIQKDILDACAQAVKVGGRLVYSTCTILPDENENQVRAFLERHPEFEMDESTTWLPEALRGRMQGGMLQLIPAFDNLEGFFIARMIRRRI